ncbi:MAG: hypothetical protein A2Z70_01015 [Chloroflexi bacterium RBG_13_48_17]|nr:MAG: hypothetical protein A2Z70_01015 [Chloroflexi bacterium RBG_13_48_17]
MAKSEENKTSTTKEYWQKNIEAYGKFYDKTSEEQIIASKPLAALYRAFIFPAERRLVLERYRKVIGFIERSVKPGMRVVDLGCGTGVFTTELLLRGASVIAVDYVETALTATKKRVIEMLPEKQSNIEYLFLDVMEKPLPKSDVVIAIGVAPYIDSIETFMNHILPTTDRFYCLFLNKYHWINRVRRLLRFLNVRRYRYSDDKIIKELLTKDGFLLVSREKIATGYLDEIERKK